MMKHLTLLAIVALASAGAANAHHGLDLYDTTHLLEIKGKVIEVRLMDPHSLLIIESQSDDGTLVEWEIEGGSAAGIISSGLTQDFLRSGPEVRIKGFQTKDGFCAPRCRVAGESFDFAEN